MYMYIQLYLSQSGNHGCVLSPVDKWKSVVRVLVGFSVVIHSNTHFNTVTLLKYIHCSIHVYMYYMYVHVCVIIQLPMFVFLYMSLCTVCLISFFCVHTCMQSSIYACIYMYLWFTPVLLLLCVSSFFLSFFPIIALYTCTYVYRATQCDYCKWLFMYMHISNTRVYVLYVHIYTRF